MQGSEASCTSATCCSSSPCATAYKRSSLRMRPASFNREQPNRRWIPNDGTLDDGHRGGVGVCSRGHVDPGSRDGLPPAPRPVAVRPGSVVGRRQCCAITSLATPRGKAPLGAAIYESHYLTAIDPAGGRGWWLRYTALKRAGGRAQATVWVTYFDPSAPGPRALWVAAPEPLRDPRDDWSSSSLCVFGPRGARGAIVATNPAAGIRRARWELSWEPRAPELPCLPARWLYDRAVPRSNGAALVPAGTAAGVVTLDGQDISVDGWDIVVGHNWGSEHPERWCWIHVTRLGQSQRGWLDLVLARVRIGPLVTPWLAAGALQLDDRRYVPAHCAESSAIAPASTLASAGRYHRRPLSS